MAKGHIFTQIHEGLRHKYWNIDPSATAGMVNITAKPFYIGKTISMNGLIITIAPENNCTPAFNQIIFIVPGLGARVGFLGWIFWLLCLYS